MSKDVVKIPYEHTKGLAYKARTAISNAAHKVFPGEPIRLVPGESTLLTPRAIADYPHAELYLEAQIRRMFGKLPRFGDNVLFLDIETHNAGKEWGMPIEEFFRLGQYAWGEGPVKLTTDLSEVVNQITRAKRVVAHNGHSFDFSVLIGDLALDLAMQGHLLDTYTFAEVVFPCPVEYIHASGRRFPNNTNPTQYRKWYGLDNLCAQFGFDGKMGNLTELAAQHNPKGTKRADLDFSLIPLDDPDFLAYADQDIVALRELTRSMLAVHPMGDYDERAQKMAAIDAQVMRNGFRVDIELAEKRRDAAQQRTEEIMDQLVRDYNFPTEGKQPWKSAAGKAAIFKALADVGITPKTRPDWTKTATGNPSLSGDTLVALTEGTEAEELGQALAMLGGMRPLAEQVLTYLKGDNRLHCDIDGIQRSGRRSTTKIGLTTFGSRKDTADKAMLLPDEGFELYSADLSGADARAVAFMSGDKNRAKWFEQGADSHEIVGRLMFGDEVYDSDPKLYRNIAKPLNHGGAYGAGPRKLAEAAGVPLEMAERYVEVIASEYPDVAKWQNKVRAEGESGWVTNRWGRKMPVQIERIVGNKKYRSKSYTQSPALLGQSSTTEVLYDGLIKLYWTNREAMNNLKAFIHDEVLIQSPIGDPSSAHDLVRCVEQEIDGITFYMECGEPAINWREATH